MFSIVSSHDKGQCMIADQDIKKGSVISRQDPIIFTGFKDVCADCLVPLSVERLVCGSCKLEYCCKDCLTLGDCNNQEIDPYTILHKRALKQLKQLKKLSSQGQEIPDVEAIYFKINHDILVDFNEFKDLSRKISTNLIGITRDLVNVGVGIYPTASFMNHDCRENTLLEFKGKEMTVKASRDIRKGEEITTRYLPIYKNRKSRMEEFRNWNFKCTCELCLLVVRDPRDLVKCQSCDGVTNENYFRCEWCQEELILDFPCQSFHKSKDSKGIKRQISELDEYLYKNHEIQFLKREELIIKLEQEHRLEDLIGVIQEQIQGLQEIFQDRLSIEIAYLEYKKWKFLEILQQDVSREYRLDVCDKVLSVFGSDHEYSKEIMYHAY